jgi:hypothetical protein
MFARMIYGWTSLAPRAVDLRFLMKKLDQSAVEMRSLVHRRKRRCCTADVSPNRKEPRHGGVHAHLQALVNCYG